MSLLPFPLLPLDRGEKGGQGDEGGRLARRITEANLEICERYRW